MLIWMRCYQAIKFLFQKLILGHEYRLFFLHIFWLWKEPFNVGLQLLQLMFKMTAVRLHTCLESHTPFFHCFVHDALIKLIPLLHKTLFEMINVLQSASVHTLLQNTPDLVVNWVEIWTVRRPVQWTDEAWSWALLNSKLHGVKHQIATILLNFFKNHPTFLSKSYQIIRW